MTAVSVHDILIRPVISEKSVAQTERNNYTFAVGRDANKFQIKAAVEAEALHHAQGAVGGLAAQHALERGAAHLGRHAQLVAARMRPEDDPTAPPVRG